MIKVSKGIYVHFTTVLLFVLCYINRKLDVLCVSYLLVTLHEMAHLAAAVFIGLKPSRLAFFPFGVNLKLKNKIVGYLSDEIILYLSGPLLNAVLGVLGMIFYKGKYSELFYCNNFGLFIFNILPIMPMDGGILANKILASRIGQRKSAIVLKCSSCILIALLIGFEGFLIFKSRFNFSVLIAAIFLMGNIFTNKEKYNLEIIRELMFYKEKDKRKIKKVTGLQIKSDTDYKDLLKDFSRARNYIIFKENKSGEIGEILTERQIIEEIVGT